MLQIHTYSQNETKAIAYDSRMINGHFKGKDIVSLDQFSAEDFRVLFALTDSMKQIVVNHEPSNLLAGYLVSLLFFEPSSNGQHQATQPDFLPDGRNADRQSGQQARLNELRQSPSPVAPGPPEKGQQRRRQNQQ